VYRLVIAYNHFKRKTERKNASLEVESPKLFLDIVWQSISTISNSGSFFCRVICNVPTIYWSIWHHMHYKQNMVIFIQRTKASNISKKNFTSLERYIQLVA